MPEQAKRTLLSLSAAYQQGVSQTAYEVIVVENSSDRVLGKQDVECHGDNFRYFYREETSRSPVNALNLGVSRARAPHVSIMIDGARMVTPGLVDTMIRAQAIAPVPVISVPGYHLGRTLQQEAVDEGYDERADAELLASIAWPADGYRLFDVSCLSGSCANGFFLPYSESNCLGMPTWFYESIGGCDPKFDLPGGGNVNLDLYRRACDDPRATLIVLPGEGSFHQYHGGVTTNSSKKSAERQLFMRKLNEQYRSLRGREFKPPRKQAIFFGAVPPEVQRFVRHSADRAMRKKSGQPLSFPRQLLP
jgi:hypothetical protein